MKLIFTIIVLSLLIGCLQSCLTPEKAKSFLERKNKLAEICADEFPVRDSLVVRDSVSFDTLYIEDPGYQFVNPIYRVDTSFGNTTPIGIYDNASPLTPLTSPKKMVITKTVRHDSLIYRENTARVEALQFEKSSLSITVNDQNREISTLKTELDRIHKRDRGKVRIPWWWLLVAGVVVFRKPIFKLIKLI